MIPSSGLPVDTEWADWDCRNIDLFGRRDGKIWAMPFHAEVSFAFGLEADAKMLLVDLKSKSVYRRESSHRNGRVNGRDGRASPRRRRRAFTSISPSVRASAATATSTPTRGTRTGPRRGTSMPSAVRSRTGQSRRHGRRRSFSAAGHRRRSLPTTWGGFWRPSRHHSPWMRTPR